MSMNFDFSKITGQIIKEDCFIGTGFLIDNNLFFTARHNVLEPLENIEEKIVNIKFPELGIFTGKTINLIKAYELKIDCVLIKLTEELCDLEFTKLVKTNQNLINFDYKVYGFPKEKQDGIYIEGIIINDKIEKNHNKDYILNVDKKDSLQSYKGLSGSPIIINDFIVGLLIQQSTSNDLFGISFKLIDNILFNTQKKIFIDDKELINLSINKTNNLGVKLDHCFFKRHINEGFRIAGPRYTQEFSLKNETFNNLLSFVKDNKVINRIEEFRRNLHHYPNKLKNCFKKDNYNNAFLFSSKTKNQLNQVITDIEGILTVFKDLVFNGVSKHQVSFFDGLNIVLKNIDKNLDSIFHEELDNFEREYGKGTFDDKNWRGNMSTYQLEFPCANLDTIKDLKVELEKLKTFMKNNHIHLFFSENLLLTGKGGIGKTHSLCDLVKYNIEREVPSLLFFGQYFKEKSPEDTIMEKINLKDFNFDDFLYRLNIVGDRLNIPVIICIDAINETEDKNYWNNHMISFVEKLRTYNFIKLIISCRTIYLSEILNEDVSNCLLKLEHTGFENMESLAVSEFFKFYNLNIPSIDKMQTEFSNPLFLKLYCETILDTPSDGKIFDISGLNDLLERFLRMKNEKIAKKFYDAISQKDQIVIICIEKIADSMYLENKNYLKWKKVRDIIKLTLEEELSISGNLVKLFLDELISENILKEDMFEGDTVSFSFERFFDYLIGRNIIKINNKRDFLLKIDELFKNYHTYKGALELITILYKEYYDIEIIDMIKSEHTVNIKFYELFLSSLTWRKNEHIDKKAKEILQFCLYYNKNQKLIEQTLFTMLELSLRKDCVLNADFFHSFFEKKDMFQRDASFGYVMLKSYENHRIVKKLLENSLYLKKRDIDIKIIQLWETILGWFTSLNDIYIRDLASKSLTNLFRLYPNSIFFLLEKFKYIDDDYIHERIWGAVYASFLLNRHKKVLIEIIKYIYGNYILKDEIPNNVVIRDFLRNIGEYGNYLKILEYNLEEFRPPYKSQKKDVSSYEFLGETIKEKYKKLYWNCTRSDFAIYTIPSINKDYDVDKKEIGEKIFFEIIKNGYREKNVKFDDFIDRKYGSLRNRDTSVERTGKKYQKIYLNRILGMIFDNYPKKSRSEYYVEKNLIQPEQGSKFRNIDLSCLPYERLEEDFIGSEFRYNFRKIRNLSNIEWFKQVEKSSYFVSELIDYRYKEDNYILLQGFFNSEYVENKLKEYPKKIVQYEVRSYLVKKNEIELFKNWIKNKHFFDEWIPEGYGLNEGWIGEYPWSASYINRMYESEEVLEILDENQRNVHVNIIPTVNNFINENDSSFCKTKIGGDFFFPCVKFFIDMELNWNGENIFFKDSKIMFAVGSGKDRTIYANKKMFDKYLNDQGFILVWTILGEKLILTEKLNNKFPGRAEISETYIYDDGNVINHNFIYRVIDPVDN